MDGHVVAHRHDSALPVEDGAGVVAALLNVGRKRGAAKGRAHFLGYGVKERLEDFEFRRVNSHSGPLISERAFSRLFER